jgi:hypothetical protein
MRLAVDRMPSSAPNTAARSHPAFPVRRLSRRRRIYEAFWSGANIWRGIFPNRQIAHGKDPRAPEARSLSLDQRPCIINLGLACVGGRQYSKSDSHKRFGIYRLGFAGGRFICAQREAAPRQTAAVRAWRADRPSNPASICRLRRTSRKRSPTRAKSKRRSG